MILLAFLVLCGLSVLMWKVALWSVRMAVRFTLLAVLLAAFVALCLCL